MSTTTTPLTEAAIEHAAMGLSVIAVGNDKRPLGSWKQYQTTPATEAEITKAMSDPRAVGFAVIGGEVSGGLEILDFDVPGFYEAWAEGVGELVMRLPVQRTGGGGYQVAYRCDKTPGNTKLAYAPNANNADGREIAIETRGEGGYAVVAPSMHPSGNRYEYITGQTFADAPHLTDAEADYLRFIARRLCKAPIGAKQAKAKAAEQAEAKPIDRSKLNGELSVIDQFNQAVPIRTMLERCGYTLDQRSGEYTRPGADASPGGVAVFDDGRSYHHSTNDIMHDGKHSVDAFELFKVYEHGGKVSDAVRSAAVELGIEQHDNAVGSAWQQHDGKTFNTDAMIANAEAKASPEQRQKILGIAPTPLGQLIHDHPQLSDPVIDGILRTAETMNIIAASKVGKSWLMYDLLISLATGRRWLDTFQCNAGRVLLIDNELHPQTIANRMPKVAAAMRVSMEDINESIDVISLRGKGMTLDKLASTIKRIEAGYYNVIVLDAWYRFIPKGVSENDNADVMALYNLLDQYAAESGAAIVAVHHASKGKQGDKAVTDVGAGAGAQSRAADAHVVLRPHEEDGCIVLEAAVRSFKPIEPLALRWEFPLWSRAEGVDTSALLDRKTKREQKNAQNDAEGIHKIIDALRGGPLTTSKVRRHAGGMGRDRAERLLGRMLDAGTVTCKDVIVRGKEGTEWTLAK